MRSILVVAGDRPADLEPGPAPMLDWIEITRLVVDDEYQRELKPDNWKAIRRIARHFRWSRFSPVFCAPVEGGLFAIIDGQHRTHAAAICGFEKVPCQIVQMDRAEQAASFAAVNGSVTAVSSHQLLKAALAAGASWAIEIESIAREAGCALMTSNTSTKFKKPGEIYGPNILRKLADEISRPVLVRSLSLLMQAKGYRDVPEAWNMTTLMSLLKAMAANPGALERPDFVEFLEGFSFWRAIDQVDSKNMRRLQQGLSRLPRREEITATIEAAIQQKFGAAA